MRACLIFINILLICVVYEYIYLLLKTGQMRDGLSNEGFRTILQDLVTEGPVDTFWVRDHKMCLQVIPEKTNIDYMNPKYFAYINTSVKRYSKRGANLFNLEFNSLQTIGNNFSFHVIFHEFLNNEYKRSFVEMHFKVCQLIEADPYIGKAVQNAGITKCPIPAGPYKLMNMSVPNVENFPYVWPFEKGKAVGYMSNDRANEKIVEGYVVLSFKQTKKRNNNG